MLKLLNWISAVKYQENRAQFIWRVSALLGGAGFRQLVWAPVTASWLSIIWVQRRRDLLAVKTQWQQQRPTTTTKSPSSSLCHFRTAQRHLDMKGWNAKRIVPLLTIKTEISSESFSSSIILQRRAHPLMNVFQVRCNVHTRFHQKGCISHVTWKHDFPTGELECGQ